jgi:altronate dehydratase small subunit
MKNQLPGQSKAIVLNPKDNVATAIADLEAGAVITLEVHGKPMVFTLASHVSTGHRFALQDPKKGDAVIKYGEPIEKTTGDILCGEHVHIHNVMSRPRERL